jgi:hypothetical protein
VESHIPLGCVFFLPADMPHTPIATALPTRSIGVRLARILQALRRLPWVAIVPSAAMFVAARRIGLPHAWINLDYVLLALLQPRKKLLWPLLITAIAADIFITGSALFGLTPADAELSFLPRALLVTVVCATLFGFALLIVRLGKQRYARDRIGFRRMALLLGALFTMDVVNGSSGIALSALRIRGNITTSAAAQTIRAGLSAVGTPRVATGVPVASAVKLALLPALSSGGGLPGAVRNDQPDVLLVIDESFGLFRDSAANAMLARAWERGFAAVPHETQTGDVRSQGATTDAEVRELCGVAGNYRYAMTANAACLPQALAARGYHTMAVHGFRGFGFHRDVWYPKIGLATAKFLPELDSAGLTGRCGALLRGACDGAIGTYVAGMLNTAEPRAPDFIYWVTLNTHLPLDPEVAASPPDHCSGFAPLSSGTLCLYARQHEQFLAGLSARLADPRCRELVVLLVGDHRPPFPRPSIREAFRQNHVPYFRTTIPGSGGCRHGGLQ